MPEFRVHTGQAGAQQWADRVMGQKKSKDLIKVATCHVCQSDNRSEIEALCVLGRPYTKISQAFDIDRRSISNHFKEHVTHEQDAVRRIIEDQASTLQVDHEEGVRGALMRRAWLDTALQKAWEDLIEGRMELEARDIVNIIKMHEEMESKTESTAAQTVWAQFNAFKLAISRVVPKEFHAEILQQARQIYDGEITIEADALEEPPALSGPEIIEPTDDPDTEPDAL